MNSLKDLFESPVGAIGRTGVKDAEAHVTDELRAEFKKIVKKLGGKTVAGQLLRGPVIKGDITEGKEEKEYISIIKKYIKKNNLLGKDLIDSIDDIALDIYDEGDYDWYKLDRVPAKEISQLIDSLGY